MEQVFAILIFVPTTLALLLVGAYIAGAILSFIAAGIDGLVVGIRHRLHPVPAEHHTHYGRPALHH